MSENGTTRQLPLHEMHEAAGARFGPFAGYSMPLSYKAGVMQEHLHTREKAGLFDISHMQLLLVTGPDAARLIGRVCPIDAAGQETGASKYTFALNDRAGIIDDLIVTRLGPERFMVVANASRAAVDEAHIRAQAAGMDVAVEALVRAFLALQGPQAAAVMADAEIDIAGLTFMHGRESGSRFLTRSGYTGEDGFEIAVPLEEAECVAGKLSGDERVELIGLGARDSLRLEAGLCLYGNDLDETTDPASAGLLWAIPKPLREGGDYVGAAALAAIIAEGPKEKRVGLKAEGRQPVRGGALLSDADGAPAGRVTSGGFGPSAGHPVAMGYVRADLAVPGTVVDADVRGKPVAMTVTKLPFVEKRSSKG